MPVWVIKVGGSLTLALVSQISVLAVYHKMEVIIFKSERKEPRFICYPWGWTVCSTEWMLNTLLRSLIAEITSLLVQRMPQPYSFTLPHSQFPPCHFPTHMNKDVGTLWRILFMLDKCQNRDLIKKQLTICFSVMCLCIYTHVYMPKNKLRENSFLHIVGWVSCQISFISDNFFMWSERIYLFLSILWHSLLNSIIHPVTNWLGYIKPLQLIYVGLYLYFTSQSLVTHKDTSALSHPRWHLRSPWLSFGCKNDCICL